MSEDAQPPRLSQTVGSTITQLQGDLLGATHQRAALARAHLAKLRRAAGSTPERDPIAWATTLGLLGEEFLDRVHTDGQATPTERAAFTALTLYAVHQQSNKARMHVPDSGRTTGNSFGYAAGLLARQRDSESVKKRFDAVVTTRHAPTRLHLVRGFVDLLSTAEVPLDYGRFAEQIRSADFPESWKRTVLIWVRDFARAFNDSQEPSHTPPAPTNS